MDISREGTDAAVLTELGRRLTTRRLARNLTQASLAHEAGVSKRTIERLEAGGSVQLSSLIKALRILDLLPHLNIVAPDAEPGPMEQLERHGRPRRRASRRRRTAATREWTWGESE